MNIVEIIPQLSSGGAERFVVDLCNELSKRHQVTLIVYYDLEDYGFYYDELSERVGVECLNKNRGLDLQLFSKIHKILRKIKPDVVHLHTRAINYIFPILFFKNDFQCFMTIHNDAEKEAGNLWGRVLRRHCFENGRIVPVAISNESLRSFREFYHLTAHMILNGRNITQEVETPLTITEEFQSYKPTSKTHVIVCVARFTKVKRQDMLARIVSRLSKEGYDISLLLIGKHLDDEVLENVKRIESDVIHILGEKNNPLDYLRLADAFCLCSSYEGMPISLIEAIGVGTIPVCTPVGGIVDVINEQNGFLSDDLSEESYYIALKRFMDTDKDTLDEMRKQLQLSYKPYSMAECAEKYESLFKQYADA